MQGQITLGIGIAFVAGTLGYMVGGSASPVVSVTVPAIFGLVLTAIGLMQASQPNKEILELLKAHGEAANLFPEVIELRSSAKSAPRRIGISLIVFSVAYISAATVGAKIRIDNLLIEKVEAPAFPWSKSGEKPPNISSALDWIALQKRLIDLGYDEPRIIALYELQVEDWKNQATSGQIAPTSDFFKQWMIDHEKYKISPGHPFAFEPKEKLKDRLKFFDLPDNARPKLFQG